MTIYYEDPTGFMIGAAILMVVFVIAVIYWPRLGQVLMQLIGKPAQQIHGQGDIVQRDQNTPAVDRDLQELETLRQHGQISEETYQARQAIIARRK